MVFAGTKRGSKSAETVEKAQKDVSLSWLSEGESRHRELRQKGKRERQGIIAPLLGFLSGGQSGGKQRGVVCYRENHPFPVLPREKNRGVTSSLEMNREGGNTKLRGFPTSREAVVATSFTMAA